MIDNNSPDTNVKIEIVSNYPVPHNMVHGTVCTGVHTVSKKHQCFVYTNLIKMIQDEVHRP